MKTVRLFVLLCWALAQVTPKTAAQTFFSSASAPTVSVLPSCSTEEESPAVVDQYLQVSQTYTDRVLAISRQATRVWSNFVDNWLIDPEKMWIWMFLLLLLLARL